MNLDDRARRATRALHDATPSDPTDLARTAERVALGAAERRRRIRGVRIAGGALAAIALLGITAVALDRRAPTDDERIAIEEPQPSSSTTTPASTTTEPPDPPDPRDPRDTFAIVPASPIDGLDSYRLPVIAIAQSGMQDGDTITVLGKGFEPGESVGIVQCASEAIQTGASACDLAGNGAPMSDGGIDYATADANGEVEATFVVHRQLVTPALGPVDCASAAERCMVGIGAISNYDRSGSTFVNFAAAPPFPTPTLAVDPTTVSPGSPSTIQVDGWLPGRSIRIEQCLADACQTLTDGYSDPTGSFAATVTMSTAVTDRNAPESPAVPCAGACVVRAVPIDIPEATALPSTEPVPVTFAGA